MIFNEEQKLSLEAGEFIHSIANLLIDGSITMENIDAHRSRIIMEISEALRRSVVVDSAAPLLLAEGFKLSEHPRSVWIDLATRIICECERSVSISVIVKAVT